MDATPTLAIPYADINDDADAAELTDAMASRIEEILLDFSPSRLAASDPGKLLVVSGTGRSAFVAMSGDAVIGATGAVQIQAKKIVRTMIDDFAISAGQLDAGSVTRSKLSAFFKTLRTSVNVPNGYQERTVNWPVAFGDTNYTMTYSLRVGGAALPAAIVSKGANGFTVGISNFSGGTLDVTIEAIGIAD